MDRHNSSLFWLNYSLGNKTSLYKIYIYIYYVRNFRQQIYYRLVWCWMNIIEMRDFSFLWFWICHLWMNVCMDAMNVFGWTWNDAGPRSVFINDRLVYWFSVLFLFFIICYRLWMDSFSQFSARMEQLINLLFSLAISLHSYFSPAIFVLLSFWKMSNWIIMAFWFKLKLKWYFRIVIWNV